MTIDFNVDPYWDDFNPTKKYKRILAIPGRVSQAREFSQAQTMLQSQITNLASIQYRDGQVLRGCLLTINSSKTQATISSGKLYAEGDVVEYILPTSIPITGVGTEIIGIVKREEIITEVDDPTLKDPASGFSNYNAPGSHRYKIDWEWMVLSGEGYGVFTLYNGELPSDGTDTPSDPKPIVEIENILDILARYNYEQFGNFVIRGLSLSLATYSADPQNYKELIVGAGTARILGYDITINSDVKTPIPVARDTDSVSNEPWVYVTYDSITDSGGQFLLGERPVASISRVVATEIAVDGVGDRPLVTRGQVPGGADDLSEESISEIIAVNQGGTWNSALETFNGGTTFPTSSYLQDGNRIDWSRPGSEPAPGSSYAVAYKYRKQLVKELVGATLSENELLTHGDDPGDDTLENEWVCETNSLTGFVFYANDPVLGGAPDPESVGFTYDYVRDVDFTISSHGAIEWYDHEVQILQITKGTAGGVDNLTGFTSSYSMGTVLDIAAYATPDDVSFDSETNQFQGAITRYVSPTSYLWSIGNPQIDWSPAGVEPTTSDVYFVAVLARKYKTSNHPSFGAPWYANYYYWDTKVEGDYLGRDSFYGVWNGVGNVNNRLVHYGLDLENYLNFWRSTAFRTNLYNVGKPYPGTLVEVNYRYYLPRYILVYFNTLDPVSLTYGISSRHPTEPAVDVKDKALLLASIYCSADSLEMTLKTRGVLTFKVHDMHDMRDRVVRTEQDLASTMLDLDARSIPITNKKGITTTSFHDNTRIDPGWDGTAYSIDPDWEELALPHTDSIYNLELDETSSTCAIYNNLCTLVPNATESIEQPFYTDHESIAPYALANQDSLQSGQSAYMTITPAGDTVIIPRSVNFGPGETQEDIDAWISSDLAKLSNPTRWFSKGWTGGTEKRLTDAGETLTTPSANQSEVWTTSYMRDIQGVCRQIRVDFTIPGGLIPTEDAELDYFLYFGNTLIDPTLTDSTPPGSLSGTFRPRPADNGASGWFTIPPNMPEGRIEIRATSNPLLINGSTWQQTVIAVYDAAVVEQLTLQFEKCRCNCWCYCNCNCWNCRGRCGTGPLAETLEPVGRLRVLKEVDIDFYSVHSKYGVYGCVINTDNGQPTSNTVSTGMIARQFRSAAQMVGAGMQKFTFDDPVFLNDAAYAVVVTGEDGFNINSISEIAAGHDIRCKIATLGKKDVVSEVVVGSQPFKNGILWRSLTGVTWEDDQLSDLKFKATFNLYPTDTENIIYLDEISVDDVTAFICNWNSTVPEGTFVTFEYRTQAGSWTEFSPYSMTYLPQVATTLSFRSRLKTSSPNITPYIAKFAGLYTQSTQPALKIATDNFVVDSSDTVDVWLDSYLPTGASQVVRLTFDNGVSWVSLASPINGAPSGNLIEYTPVDLNVSNTKYRYHWQVILTAPNTYSQVRAEIACNVVGGDSARLKNPRFSRLIIIASTS
jgi:hypothetical protein